MPDLALDLPSHLLFNPGDVWILFGGCLALVLAGTQLLRPAAGRGNQLLAALLISIALWQCPGGLYGPLARIDAFGLINRLHPLAVIAYLCTGPLLFLYFARALHADLEWRAHDLWHFLPAALSAGAYIACFLWMPAATHGAEFLFGPVPSAIGLAAAATLVVYAGSVLWVLGRLVLASQSDLPAATNRLALGLMAAVGAMATVELFSSSDELNMLVSALIVALYWIGARHPAFLQDLREAAEQQRYAQSQLSGLAVDRLSARLNALMSEEELYRDEQLRLRDLAERLEITGHQLSELLNTRFDRNFYSFVNQHRIEHARRLLRERPELPITAVGFESGFNTNSVFYDAFRKATGQAPDAYRRDAQAS